MFPHGLQDPQPTFVGFSVVGPTGGRPLHCSCAESPRHASDAVKTVFTLALPVPTSYALVPGGQCGAEEFPSGPDWLLFALLPLSPWSSCPSVPPRPISSAVGPPTATALSGRLARTARSAGTHCSASEATSPFSVPSGPMSDVSPGMRFPRPSASTGRRARDRHLRLSASRAPHSSHETFVTRSSVHTARTAGITRAQAALGDCGGRLLDKSRVNAKSTSREPSPSHGRVCDPHFVGKEGCPDQDLAWHPVARFHPSPSSVPDSGPRRPCRGSPSKSGCGALGLAAIRDPSRQSSLLGTETRCLRHPRCP